MNRLLATLICAAAVAASAQPAAALDPLPPSNAVVKLQETRQYLAPLAICQVNALIVKVQALVAAAGSAGTVSGIINSLGLPSDPGVHDLALLILATATHGADQEYPTQRATVQPLERLAATAAASVVFSPDTLDSAARKLPPGTCAGLSPIVVPTPNIDAIAAEKAKFDAKAREIAVYLTPSMLARLARIATAMHTDGSLTSSAAVLASVKTQLSGVQLSAAQLALLQYATITAALDGQFNIGTITSAEAAVREKQLPAFAEALKSIQASMPSPDSIVQNIPG